MIRSKLSSVLLLSLLLCMAALSGCATKLPKTTPLPPDRQQEAVNLFVAFSQAPQPIALDADIRLGWDVLGSKGGVDATLQVQKQLSYVFRQTIRWGERSLLLLRMAFRSPWWTIGLAGYIKARPIPNFGIPMSMKLSWLRICFFI